MKSYLIRQAGILLAVICLPFGAQAAARNWHFPVGIAYAQGSYEVMDSVFDMYENAGYDISDRFIIPVGLVLSPYYEFDSGLGIGATVGPTAFLFISEEYYSGYDNYLDETHFSYIIPVGADVRYTFLRDGAVSPYVKVGFRYPIAGGDNVDSSEIGFYGGAGIELWRNKAVGLGIEVGYDSSSVTVRGPDGGKDKVTYGGFMVALQALF